MLEIRQEKRKNRRSRKRGRGEKRGEERKGKAETRKRTGHSRSDPIIPPKFAPSSSVATALGRHTSWAARTRRPTCPRAFPPSTVGMMPVAHYRGTPLPRPSFPQQMAAISERLRPTQPSNVLLCSVTRISQSKGPSQSPGLRLCMSCLVPSTKIEPQKCIVAVIP